ncbi:MAG: hypothetical protein H8E18_16595 [FCB group bacterium]|nr:hypothetical protein [FCB group bacterium]
MTPQGVIYTDVAFRFPRKHLQGRLKLLDHPDLISEFDTLLDEAIAIARPKVVFRPVLVNKRGEGFVQLEGHRLESHILASQLVSSNRVYVFAASCGEELESWSLAQDDPLKYYWAHEILGIALERAVRHLKRQLVALYDPGKLTTIDPGATVDWPLAGQTLLFELLGDLPAQIGLALLPSHIMKPTKSASGIIFPTTHPINRCRLCDLEGCFERSRPYDASLFAGQHDQTTP